MEHNVSVDKISGSINLPSNLKGNYKEEYYEKSLKPQFTPSERREKAKRDAIEKQARLYGQACSKVTPDKVSSFNRKRNKTTIDSGNVNLSLTFSTTAAVVNAAAQDSTVVNVNSAAQDSTVVNVNSDDQDSTVVNANSAATINVTSKSIFENINENRLHTIFRKSSPWLGYKQVKVQPELQTDMELSDLRLCDGSGDDIDPNEVLEKIRKREIIAKYYFVISSHIGIGLWNYSSICTPEYLEVTIQQVPITRSTVFESNDFYATIEYEWINPDNNNEIKKFVIQYTRGLKRFIMSKYPRFLFKAIFNPPLSLGEILNSYSGDNDFCINLYVNIIRGKTWNIMTSMEKPVCFIFRYYGNDKSNNNDNSLERFTVQVTKWPHKNTSIASENLTASFLENKYFFLCSAKAAELFIHDKKCWIIQDSSKLHGLISGTYKTKVLAVHLKESAELDYLYTIYYNDKETNHISSSNKSTSLT
jgi:hypothetical protein